MIKKKIKVFTLIMISYIFCSLNGYSQLKVISNGNVGIGTYNPTSKLEVVGDGTSEIRLWGTNSNIARIWAINYNYAYGFGIDGSGIGHIYSNLNNPSHLMSFYQNKVGVLRTPNYTLDVNGIIRGLLVTSSDERLKTNIVPLQNSLKLIRDISGVSYKYKSSGKSELKPEKEHFGFIAQDFGEIMPNLIYKDDEGLLSIDYISMIPVLVEAVKELDNAQKYNEQLQVKLENLENNYEELKDEFLALKMSNKDEVYSNIPKLFQNKPNPFDQETKISFYLPSESNNAFIYIYDMQGAQIKSFNLPVMGYSDITLQNTELLPGIYMYTLIVDGLEIATKKMILTK